MILWLLKERFLFFALVISEVLLVNMWMQDIGRYNAANLALLKIVFEFSTFQRENQKVNGVRRIRNGLKN